MKKLYSHIKESGLSVEQIAGRVGIAPSTIYRALCGRTQIRLNTLVKISSAIGVPVSKLISESPDKATSAKEVIGE